MKYYIEEIETYNYSQKNPTLLYGLFTKCKCEYFGNFMGWYIGKKLHETTLLAIKRYSGGKCLENKIVNKYYDEMIVTLYEKNRKGLEAENNDEAIEKFFNMKLEIR